MQTFSRAIELNPRYARAYAGIADCHSFLCLYLGGGAAAATAADQASAKAIEIDPDLAEAHASRGLAHFVAHDYEAAQRELQRALDIDASLYEPHYIFGRICLTQGDHASAAMHFRQACAVMPQAFDSWYLLAMCYRRLDNEARAHAADLECIEAVKQRIAQHPDDTRARTMGAGVLAQLGEPERAHQWIEQALAIDREEPMIAYNSACVLVLLGDRDGALTLLDSVAGAGGPRRAWIENDPDLDPLRSDPRFQSVIDRLPA